MDAPAVLEAAVVAVPDDRWQERPLAVIVAMMMQRWALTSCERSWATSCSMVVA